MKIKNPKTGKIYDSIDDAVFEFCNSRNDCDNDQCPLADGSHCNKSYYRVYPEEVIQQMGYVTITEKEEKRKVHFKYYYDPKDKKTFSAIESALTHYCLLTEETNSLCGDYCPFYHLTNGNCMHWAKEHPEEAVSMMNYLIIDENTPLKFYDPITDKIFDNIDDAFTYICEITSGDDCVFLHKCRLDGCHNFKKELNPIELAEKMQLQIIAYPNDDTITCRLAQILNIPEDKPIKIANRTHLAPFTIKYINSILNKCELTNYNIECLQAVISIINNPDLIVPIVETINENYLTWDELIARDGKPVYVIMPKTNTRAWALITAETNDEIMLNFSKISTIVIDKESYGNLVYCYTEEV